jgi:hypothetical protein
MGAWPTPSRSSPASSPAGCARPVLPRGALAGQGRRLPPWPGRVVPGYLRSPVSGSRPPWETSQKWRCAFFVGTLLLAAGAALEGRWPSAIAWTFFVGLWGLLIFIKWKEGR